MACKTGFKLVLNVGKTSSLGGISKVCNRFASASTASYKHILTEKKGEKQNVGLIRLNRPKSGNSISLELLQELENAFKAMDADDSLAAVVLTGHSKYFALGVDLHDMMNLTYADHIKNNDDYINFGPTVCKKPVIAAVNGLAFGLGCELAWMCDIIYAGDKAFFGQPEVSVGVIPGAGGSQRVTRSAGKSKAMEMCLSGEPISALEAEKMGLVSKVFPDAQVVDEAVKLGERIGKHSPLIVKLCKEAVNIAFETTLSEGLRFERKTFYATFATVCSCNAIGSWVMHGVSVHYI